MNAAVLAVALLLAADPQADARPATVSEPAHNDSPRALRVTVLVAGKVTLTGDVPDDLDCTYSINHLVRREPRLAPPPEVAALGFDITDGW